MRYPVRCECGKVYQFAAAQAGNHYTCPCGRVLVVPSLSRLKMAAGEEVLSPEVRLEQMLRLGMLPQQTRCVVCRAETVGTAHFWAICERTSVQQGPGRGPLGIAAGWFLFGWLSLIPRLYHARDERVVGNDLRFRLPLRVCPTCVPSLDAPGRLEEAVLAVPLYADLLDKYPRAELAPDAERNGVDLSAGTER